MFSGRQRIQNAVAIVLNSRNTILHKVKDPACYEQKSFLEKTLHIPDDC